MYRYFLKIKTLLIHTLFDNSFHPNVSGLVAGDRNQLDLLRAEKAIKALKTNENFLDLLITSKGLSPIKP
tara:strand:- start:304 stop:513 length:210 start_codon:yes stop_codon:yes gene_type:complete